MYTATILRGKSGKVDALNVVVPNRAKKGFLYDGKEQE